MFLRITVFSLLLTFSSAAFAEKASECRASEVFDWPPVFEAMFGDPKIQAGKGGFRSTIVFGAGFYNVYDGIARGMGSSWVTVNSPKALTSEKLHEAAARGLAKRFYQRVLHPNRLTRYESLLEMRELIDLDRDQFVELAVCRLMGKSSGSEVKDAWWTVRMGVPVEADPSRHLVLINLFLDVEKGTNTHGHFCFGLRQRGGDAQNDLILDFRAPWYLDREPKVTEAVNLHNKLQISATKSNLYDWLYTQTEYRGCYVKCWFLPVTREQMVLINHYASRDIPHQGGSFRPFRKNCASMGQLYLNRLGPFTEPTVAARPPSIDFPQAIREKIVKKYDGVPVYTVPNVTDELGREFTSKSYIHHAQPSRETSRAFQFLSAAPGIN